MDTSYLRHPEWFSQLVESYCTKQLNETAKRLNPKDFTTSVTAEVTGLVRVIKSCRSNRWFNVPTHILHGLLHDEMSKSKIDLTVINYVLLMLGHA